MDDNTFSIGCETPEELSLKLNHQYKTISNYMNSNRLVINNDKTHLLVMCKRTLSDKRDLVSVVSGEHTIKPTKTQKLLGARICENLKFREHILDNEQSLVKQLTSRLNGISLINKRTSFKSRLMTTNAIFMSKL